MSSSNAWQPVNYHTFRASGRTCKNHRSAGSIDRTDRLVPADDAAEAHNPNISATFQTDASGFWGHPRGT